MHDELPRTLYHVLFKDPLLSKPPRRGRHPDALILLIHCLSCATHLSVLRLTADFACWPLWMRRLFVLPSDSTVSRRMNSPAMQQHLQRLHRSIVNLLPGGCDLKIVDGLPMTVGGFSHDPDAKRGHVPGGTARGYKLHNLVNPLGVIEAFAVTPLNVYEPYVAADLIHAGLAEVRGCELLGDANYDAFELYQAVADAGGRLLCPRRRPHTGLGHCPQHPDRLKAIAELETDPAALARQRRRRGRIEQIQAHLCNLPHGLFGLPKHVRRIGRVTRFAWAKVFHYHLHLLGRAAAT